MSAEKAAIFHKLHEELLILPNTWDAASARIVEDAGAKAIATSSAAVAWAQGYADGHHFPVDKLIEVVKATERAVTIPITCDAEGGYSDDPKQAVDNVAKLIDAGAVGINLEDNVYPHELHLKKIEAIRAMAEKKGVNLYINARTDVYLKALAPPEQAAEETLRRAAAIERAGASGLFVPGIADAAQIGVIVSGTKLPLNIMARPGAPSAAKLRELGVRRVSAATGLFNAAMAAAREAAEDFLRDADSEALWQRRGSPPDYNKLFGG
ncbi:isocitrate lyase/PEP mutase family protein [Candidatus Viadribacter manganicus]|uniref:PEP phosphonomutase n=1 Tax=Candidatus Viadribacter manganicus TaxID=1759059 RepID=A0A1B1ANC2_9PROT|nr:isocitrate lyase/phosphoenolpyruvate mutase family protein [Candidatus Viadribacter manganicus]ANP48054.1 PEP phosphonomutase [Candidatus Viadribacter manganicus]